MRLLLDTHVLLWWLNDRPRLSSKARDATADRRGEVFVSAATPWEVSVKHRIGKLSENGARLLAELDRLVIPVLVPTASHYAVLEGLSLLHRDPFDHLIVAQAIADGLTLVTADRQLAA